MQQVDLRTIIGRPRGNSPILVACPCHNDPAASLAVYADHAYCYGKRRYFRRYESAALLLGLWDGKPETVEQAVYRVRPMLGKIKIALPQPEKSSAVKPIDPALADTFHRYLLASPDALCYFKQWRGLTDATIDEFKLGWTGTAFSIPVFGLGGELVGMRYRADDRLRMDTPKYSGLSGHNTATPYSLVNIEDSEDLWVFEGELDSIVGHQLGLPSATMTNGAGSLARLPGLLKDSGLNPRRWVLATDQDEAGEQAAWELKQQLGSAAVRARWDSNYKDISAFHVAGGTRKDIRLTGQEKWSSIVL